MALVIALALSCDQGPDDQPHPPERGRCFARVILLWPIADIRHGADQVGQFFAHFVVQQVCRGEVEAVCDSTCQKTLVLARIVRQKRQTVLKSFNNDGK